MPYGTVKDFTMYVAATAQHVLPAVLSYEYVYIEMSLYCMGAWFLMHMI